MYLIGIDIGGTFTDVVALDLASGRLRAAKAFTVRGNESRGVLDCLDELGIPGVEIDRLVHGTTIGTNAILERRGGRTALLVTGGFRDLLEIGRTRRMHADTMFSLTFRRPPALVPRPLRFDVDERILASGEVMQPLDEASLVSLLRELKEQQIESFAVCYLHSYRNPEHEIRTREILAEAVPEAIVSLSHEVVPEYREFERLTTTVLNAYIAPVMDFYLGNLSESLSRRGGDGRLFVMASSGGITSAERAKKFPVQTVLSGPAGGVSASVLAGRNAGLANLITCDIGGTSSDVAMISNLDPRISIDNVIDGIPLKVPQVDISTVGAGGGSIASVDEHGHLSVGPRSAGSTPGPICYGRGGTEVTVTDANLVLQRLALERPLGGKIVPSIDAARAAIRAMAERLGIDEYRMAAGIIRLAVTKMVGTIREISISRGYDPRECVLVAFGGAGPMHAVAIAEELKIGSILVPAFAGNFSALGLLASDIRHDLAETVLLPNRQDSMAQVTAGLQSLREKAKALLVEEGFPAAEARFAASLEMRYVGQAFEIRVPLEESDWNGSGEPNAEALLESFHRIYESRYGHANRDQRAEIVNLRLVASIATAKPRIENPTAAGNALIARRAVHFDELIENTPVYDRDLLARNERLHGPAIIEESSSTTVIPPGWTFLRDAFDNIRIEYAG